MSLLTFMYILALVGGAFIALFILALFRGLEHEAMSDHEYWLRKEYRKGQGG